MPKILFIDTTDNDVAEFAIVDEENYIRERFLNIPTAENFALAIKKFLKAQKLEPSNISKIAVRVGPGFFSRVRTGVVAANAFAYALNIKLVAVKGKVNYKKLIGSKGVGMVTPVYGAAPHITKAKSVWQA